MYVPFETYADSAFAGLDEQQYGRVASIADALIDDWTYGRVGKAVGRGEELPRPVTDLYSAIASNATALVESSKNGTSAELSSFSNGVDSYGFDTSESDAQRLHDSLQWLIDALPVRWTSACAYTPDGLRDRGCWHAC